MAAFTSKATGNWATSGQTTWNEPGVPGSGDTVTIAAHVITVTADTVIGAGTATTCVTVGTVGGQLVITGAKFTVKGNMALGAYNGGTVGDYLILNPNGSTQGGIEFDGNSGVTPTVTTNYDTRCVSNGTNSGHCYVRTKSGSAGNNAFFTGAGGVTRTGFWLATYTDFTRLGTSSQSGIFSTSADGGAAFATNPTHFTESFDHCVFDSCGSIPDITTATDGTGIWSFTNCTWSNSLASITTGCMAVNMGTFAIAGIGVRLIDSCLFLARPSLSSPRDFTITNNYFGDSLFTNASQPAWASCDGNFIYRSSNDANEVQSAGGFSNNYLYGDAALSQATLHFFLMNQAGASITNNVGEYAGSAVGPGVDFFGETEGNLGTANNTYTFKYNIFFNSGSGSMQPIAPDSNQTLTFKNFTICEHNTFQVNATNCIEGATTNGMKASSWSSLKANICYNSGSSTGHYLWKDTDSTPRTPITDTLPAANALANCWKGFATTSGNPFSGISGDTNIENGTVYYSPMSGSTAPGSGDLANVDPGFADATRNLATWSTHKGGAGTAADALSRLRADLTLCKTDLIPWVRAGYAPTNAALKNASYSGDSSSVDAAGTAWPGGAPGIGAMGVKSSAAVLTASAGSFAVAGSTAGSKFTRRLTTAPGSFAVAGHAATLIGPGTVDYFKPRPWFGAWWSGRWTNRTGVAGYRLVAGTGSFAVSGSAAGLTATRKLAASAGVFTVTASASTGVSGHRLIAATGSFTITASNAGEVIGRRLIAAPGSFSIAASASTGISARKITAVPGTFTVTASAAGLVAGHRLTSAAGSFVVTASASSGTFMRRLTAATGTFILAGQPAALLHGIPGNFRLVALTGSFSVAGSPAGSSFTRRLTASSGSFAVTGQPSTGISTHRLLAAAGSFTVTGSASSEVTGRRLTAGVGSFVVTASPSGEIIGRRLVAATGSFIVAGASIGTGTGRRMVVAPGSFVITAFPAGLVTSRRLVAGTGSFVITGYPAWLRRSGQAGAYPDPFAATSSGGLDPFAAVSVTTLDPFAATSRLFGS